MTTTPLKTDQGEEVDRHLGQFFDAVDKLRDLQLELDEDLLMMMLLHSLPASFEHLRCAPHVARPVAQAGSS